MTTAMNYHQSYVLAWDLVFGVAGCFTFSLCHQSNNHMVDCLNSVLPSIYLFLECCLVLPSLVAVLLFSHHCASSRRYCPSRSVSIFSYRSGASSSTSIPRHCTSFLIIVLLPTATTYPTWRGFHIWLLLSFDSCQAVHNHQSTHLVGSLFVYL